MVPNHSHNRVASSSVGSGLLIALLFVIAASGAIAAAMHSYRLWRSVSASNVPSAVQLDEDQVRSPDADSNAPGASPAADAKNPAAVAADDEPNALTHAATGHAIPPTLDSDLAAAIYRETQAAPASEHLNSIHGSPKHSGNSPEALRASLLRMIHQDAFAQQAEEQHRGSGQSPPNAVKLQLETGAPFTTSKSDRHYVAQQSDEQTHAASSAVHPPAGLPVSTGASAYDVMNSESASVIIQQLDETGQFDMAVQLLEFMKDRQAAKVLEAVLKPKPDLAERLIDRLLERKNGSN